MIRNFKPSALAKLVSLTVISSAALVGCASAAPDSLAPSNRTASTVAPDIEPPSPEAPTETASLKPRLAVTYDGGVKVLDANSFKLVADLPLDGYLRLNPTGDGRHISVSASGGFYLLDLGVWAEAHGDHAHYYAQTPTLTSKPFVSAEKPGHVIAHDGMVAFFDDATATGVTYDLLNFPANEPLYTYRGAEPHHGFLIPRADGTFVTTAGTTEDRRTVLIAKNDGTHVTSNNQCPGVHGEASAKDGIITVGCQDGILVVNDNSIQKTASPDQYGRIGNQSGSHKSSYILGDYKSDQKVEIERPTRVSLTDTSSGDLTLVDLPTSYYFRSLAHDAEGTPLVLGTDGSIHVIDESSATVARSIPVTSPWEESTQWQNPHPDLFELDGTVFVTAPHEKRIYAVDIQTGKVWNTADLDFDSIELAGALGAVKNSK